jgi:hypothetical protein
MTAMDRKFCSFTSSGKKPMRVFASSAFGWLFGVAAFLGGVAGLAQGAPNVSDTAAKVDTILAEERYGDSESTADATSSPAPLVDDATFLRRVSLDIVGELPSTAEQTRFALDPSADKRTRMVNQLLADSRYGQNWARYWRDVIFMRRSDERSLSGIVATEQYLANQLNAGASWAEIARDFVTATGDASENGACGIFIAQMADPSNVAAEISRVFMGVQIQCAQCHNHPYDRWKREQFHELAAFFPRVVVRPNRDGANRSFLVMATNRAKGPRSPADKEPVKIEHYMPDLQNPDAEGTLIAPALFSTGQNLAVGSPDLDRRGQLAEWLTSRGNAWFAKAYVNRMWGELLGQGFQEPLDDLGPDRTPVAADTFNFLAREFTASGNDPKWLIQVICATEAYQRASRPRHGEPADRFAASCSQRLRGDQLYDAINSVLAIEFNSQQKKKAAKMDANYRKNQATPRNAINRLFGYDPSDPRDEVATSIPQALYLMNSTELNRAMYARNVRGTLGQMLERQASDKQIIDELYLRTLAREPNDSERQRCLEYIASEQNREAALEDLQWALVNSTEFLFRR